MRWGGSGWVDGGGWEGGGLNVGSNECDRGAEAVVRWGVSAWVDGGGWEGGV